MSSETNKEPYRKEWMSNDQYECHKMLADVVLGFHHIPGKVKPWGDGIEINIYGSWASFDFSELTRCIILGHDKMIRVEVGNSGRGMFRLVLHKRHTRKGNMSERMPTIEDAIKEIRSE